MKLEAYLSYGITWTGNDRELNPDGLRVICHKIIVNSSVVPVKLRRHLETNHPELVGKDKEYFQAKLRPIKQSDHFM
jgi:hypothetical protein